MNREYMQGSLSSENTEVSTQEIALLLARLACNAHTICDELLQPMGEVQDLPNNGCCDMPNRA